VEKLQVPDAGAIAGAEAGDAGAAGVGDPDIGTVESHVGRVGAYSSGKDAGETQTPSLARNRARVFVRESAIQI